MTFTCFIQQTVKYVQYHCIIVKQINNISSHPTLQGNSSNNEGEIKPPLKLI